MAQSQPAAKVIAAVATAAALLLANAGCGTGDVGGPATSAAATDGTSPDVSRDDTRYADNRPWYPSLAAFEHHDSGRSHVFSDAEFDGAMNAANVVDVQASTDPYPSGWNVTYLDEGATFLYGGGDGNEASSIGSYVTRIDPDTLAPVWTTQLTDTQQSGEWDYPGTLGILADGRLYVVYGYRLSKVDPESGDVLATLALPHGDAAPGDTAYNGFTATADGLLVAKSIYRQAGCTVQGPDALDTCPDPSAVPSSVLSTINPATMEIVSTVTLEGQVLGRATVGEVEGHEFVYLFTDAGFIRYQVNDGELALDDAWSTGPLLGEGQTIGWATVVIGDWVISQCNGLPAAAPLTVYAVRQSDDAGLLSIQPFADDPIRPEIRAAYRNQGPDGAAAVSFIPSTLSADPDSDTIFAMDALPGRIAAIHISDDDLEVVWKVEQTTTEFIAVIGPPESRTLVTTDVPGEELPGVNRHNEVVWRDAASGAELARSERLPAMTPATMVQPSYNGTVLYPGLEGTLYRLTPRPA